MVEKTFGLYINNMSKITYIIPTMNRPSLVNSITSILSQDPTARIILQQGGSAGENRNSGLLSEIVTSTVVDGYSDWIAFLDDDDFYREGYLAEIDGSYDLVVIKMVQNGVEIPRDSNLVGGNVGINFVISTSFLSSIMLQSGDVNTAYLFDSLGHGEDWRFLEKILKHNPRVKITDKVYYECSQVNHML
jgi:glycosyltransferase involved in cell wall biosynthesis